ncbi:hypothetical protein COW36_07565 [bacterium (Candidatus Blackallbacteria) CG17_big_fil_post_rev_8_21_14_2_50_48_46]|uniref:Uncharacterized protein n=1 Tax=bacterium (Candidatus Blackallbacteria) CG17_big_fil_post_rev_8_21_14_2_50_48_46 TaxID=2014261 RepID=A0A2M7G6M8_9BACT|nr:MAG: hypothetical protein COW64_06270 [bacterium (Candidatus Blackallbacteria) CG18_big_fil_WC_8_21_14_2_50_49_26]PIW17697.1 MAG: hypothetical protein COW36_07565 [bacterium (Candidatus Blackallbacteria) CG17_big_fil_post_rev_8_21_14_2_50_48_46]PIW47513.1 MAG: hypothetical protein COW20_12310 [bacterium (Candidatus Blackallbacteria) CG13_big_fil_rev_8_21_14_2_50_49_14]
MSIFGNLFVDGAECPFGPQPALCFAEAQVKFIPPPVFEANPIPTPPTFPASSVLGSGYFSMKFWEY